MAGTCNRCLPFLPGASLWESGAPQGRRERQKFSCFGYEAFSLTRFAGPLTQPGPFVAQREPKSDYNFISC